MTKINIKVWRDIKQMKLRGVAIIIAIAFWVAAYGGYYMAIESGRNSFDTICQDLNVADLEVFIAPSTEDEIPIFNLPLNHQTLSGDG